MNLIQPKTALISLSDKTNLEELIAFLISQNVTKNGVYGGLSQI